MHTTSHVCIQYQKKPVECTSQVFWLIPVLLLSVELDSVCIYFQYIFIALLPACGLLRYTVHVFLRVCMCMHVQPLLLLWTYSDNFLLTFGTRSFDKFCGYSLVAFQSAE